jgi:hypothetical protein
MALNEQVLAEATTQPAQPESQAGDAASPQEQAAYEGVILAGIKILSDESTGPQIMSVLKSGSKDPAENLASATALIFSQIDEKSGGRVPEIVIAQATGVILDEVAEFATESGTMQIDKSTKDKASQYLWQELANMGFDIDPSDTIGLSSGMSEEELGSMVQAQDAAANSGQPVQQSPQQQPAARPHRAAQPATAQSAQQPIRQAAPQTSQQLPGIINSIVGA